MRHRFLIIAGFLLALAACKKAENTSSAITATASTDTTSSTSTAATATTGTATGTGSTGGSASTLTTDEKTFVMKAAEGGIAEVSMGAIAAQQGTSADVKTFGMRMVNDHGKANDELAPLAKNKGLALPNETDREHKNDAAKLSKLTGAAFDKAYMEAMVKDHEKDVAEFEKASKEVKDPDLKAWVSKTLPVIQDHLRMAKEMVGRMK